MGARIFMVVDRPVCELYQISWLPVVWITLQSYHKRSVYPHSLPLIQSNAGSLRAFLQHLFSFRLCLKIFVSKGLFAAAFLHSQEALPSETAHGEMGIPTSWVWSLQNEKTARGITRKRLPWLICVISLINMLIDFHIPDPQSFPH